MPKARRVGHRRRRPSAYEQAGLAKVTGDGPFLRNVSIFGTAFKGVVACNKSSTRLIAASKPLRCTRWTCCSLTVYDASDAWWHVVRLRCAHRYNQLCLRRMEQIFNPHNPIGKASPAVVTVAPASEAAMDAARAVRAATLAAASSGAHSLHQACNSSSSSSSQCSSSSSWQSSSSRRGRKVLPMTWARRWATGGEGSRVKAAGGWIQ